KHNQVAGFDTRWKINKQSTFSGQLLCSISRNSFYDPNTDDSKYGSGKGASYNYQYNFNSTHYGWGVGGEGTTDRFRADLGFTRQNNTMQNFTYFNLNPDPTLKGFIIQKNFGTCFG